MVQGAAFFVAMAVASFLLGNRLYGPLAGLTAAMLVLSSRGQLEYSIAGLTETGAGFFVVCAALLTSVAGDPRRDPRPVAFSLGVVIGLVVAFFITPFMASLLFAVSARDPWMFLGIVLVLGTVTLVSALLPARRAARVEPLVALRYE